jgi:hypothetical protein
VLRRWGREVRVRIHFWWVKVGMGHVWQFTGQTFVSMEATVAQVSYFYILIQHISSVLKIKDTHVSGVQVKSST